MARRNRPTRQQRTQHQTSAAPPSAMEQLLQTEEGHWRSARLLASTIFGTFAPAITALIPRFFEAREGLKVGLMTMGVDKFFRVYVNNGFTKHLVKAAREVTPENPCTVCGATSHHDLAYVAGVICHEAQHPVRLHSDRAIEIGAEPRLFNVAADLEINDDLLETFKVAYQEHQQQGLPFPQLCLPVGVQLPKLFRAEYPMAQYGIDFPDDRIAEEYYWKLFDLRDKSKDSDKGKGQGQKGKGQGGGGQPKHPDELTDEELEEIFSGNGEMMDNNGQDCGSGAHGDEGDYEDGDPSPDKPGISEAENEAIQREIAKNIQNQQNTRGNVPAGMRRWADKVLTPPKVRWQDIFKRLVRAAVARSYGHDQRSWTRLGRMTAATGGRYLFPSTFSPKPKVGIVLDTSGSMGGGETNSPLHVAVSETEGICKAVGCKVSFLSVDAEAGEIKEVSNFKDAAKLMQGGGGTDMRVGIKAMQEMKEPPQVCVVLTDGDTPWPSAPVKDMSVIAALVAGDREVPNFIKKVLVED